MSSDAVHIHTPLLTPQLCLSFRPFPEDCDDWVKAGAKGWDSESMQQYGDRIKLKIGTHMVRVSHRQVQVG